jgi:predicted ATP-grasp superfamily ATP-dependent carboligase
MSTALILGIDSNIALAAGRSLHHHGVRVVGVARTSDAIGLCSRCFRKRHVLSERDCADPASFVDAVFRIAKDEGCETLMTPSETWMRLLNKYRGQAPKGLRYCFPAEAILERVMNKSCVVSVAEEVGLHVPHTASATNGDALRSLSSTVKYPVMLKFANAGKRPSGADWHFKSLYVESAAELNRLASLLPECEDSLLVQEYAAGRYESLGIAVSRNKVLAAFQWAALREYKAGLGGFRVSLPVNEILLEKSLSLLNRLAYEGVAEVEFRYNPDVRQLGLST